MGIFGDINESIVGFAESVTGIPGRAHFVYEAEPTDTARRTDDAERAERERPAERMARESA